MKKMLILFSLGILVWISPKLYQRIRLVGVKTPEDFGVCFIEDTPGATERFVEFIPVSCQNKDLRLGDESFGADYGTLSYEDLDGDNIVELIVATAHPWIWMGDCYSPSRAVYKLHPEPPVSFTLVEEHMWPSPCAR